MTEFSAKFATLRFAIYRHSFDAEIAVHLVRRVKWGGKSV
jgi:hypothetical protein